MKSKYLEGIEARADKGLKRNRKKHKHSERRKRNAKDFSGENKEIER